MIAAGRMSNTSRTAASSRSGDTSDVPNGKLRELIEKRFLSTVFDDLEIWRYQKYVERPALSKVDAKGYMALRKWATQFYDVPPEVTASA